MIICIYNIFNLLCLNKKNSFRLGYNFRKMHVLNVCHFKSITTQHKKMHSISKIVNTLKKLPS